MFNIIRSVFKLHHSLLITLCSLLFVIGCKSDKEKIATYSSNGETQKIIGTIHDIDSQLDRRKGKIRGNSQKYKTARFAITKLVTKYPNESPELSKLENLYSVLETQEIKRSVINIFNDNGHFFSDWILTCNQYLKNDNKGLVNGFLTMIVTQNELELYDKCFQLGVKSAKENNNNTYQERIVKMIEAIPFQSMSDYKINDWITEKEQWIKFQNSKDKLSDLEERQNVIEEDIRELEQEIDDTYFIPLTGIIVEKLGVYNSHHMYKIVSGRSTNPSLLTTSETIFNSQGSFRMYVKKSGEIPYKSRLGFDKKFDAYVEVTKDDREALAEKKERLEQLKRKIEEIYTGKSEIQNLLTKLSSQIQGEENRNENKGDLEFAYQSSQVHVDLRKKNIGMSISEAASTFHGLRKVTGESYDLGYDGGGPVYLYYDNEDLMFGLVTSQGTETIKAIVVISPKLKTQNGLNPNSTAGEILNKYPDIKVIQGAFLGWEYISKESESWSFVFKTDDSKTVGEYAVRMSETPSEIVNLDIKADWVTIK